MKNIFKDRNKLLALILISLSTISIIVLLLIPPISQNPIYHCFADSRTIWGITNFFNVISNMPFLVVGIIGTIIISKNNSLHQAERLCYLLFFIGTALTGIGSSWYHLAPSNSTLVWDRLPMTIAFISFFFAIINAKFKLKLILPLLFLSLLMGIASIAYWYLGELKGQGDLRPYVFIQFFPIIGVLSTAIIYPQASDKKLFSVILWYGLAKFFEITDKEFFYAGEIIIGHSLKHIAGSIAILQILLMTMKLEKTTTKRNTELIFHLHS